MMVFSEECGDDARLSLLVSEKLRVMRGILLMVLYLVRFESDVEPKMLDLIWLNGPKANTHTNYEQDTTLVLAIK